MPNMADSPEPIQTNGHSKANQFPNTPRNSVLKRKTALMQVVELQDRAFAIANDPEVKPSIACFAMRSWATLQEERRKLKMQPLPKPIEVGKQGKRKAQTGPAYQEPEPKQAPEVAQTTSTSQPKPTQSPDNQGK